VFVLIVLTLFWVSKVVFLISFKIF
jgi:hypothetical protein